MVVLAHLMDWSVHNERDVLWKWWMIGCVHVLLYVMMCHWWKQKEWLEATSPFKNVFNPTYHSYNITCSSILYAGLLLLGFSLVCLSPIVALISVKALSLRPVPDLLQLWVVDTIFILSGAILPFVAYAWLSGTIGLFGLLLQLVVLRLDGAEALDKIRVLENSWHSRDVLQTFAWVIELLAPIIFLQASAQTATNFAGFPPRVEASAFQLFTNLRLEEEFNDHKTPHWIREFHRSFGVDQKQLITITPYAEAHPWFSHVMTGDLLRQIAVPTNFVYHLSIMIVVVISPWLLPGSSDLACSSKLRRGAWAVTPLILERAIVDDVWSSRQLLVAFVSCLPVCLYEVMAKDRYRLLTLISAVWTTVTNSSEVALSLKKTSFVVFRSALTMATLAFIIYQVTTTAYDITFNESLCIHACMTVDVCRMRLASLATMATLFAGNLKAVILGNDSWLAGRIPLWQRMATGKLRDRNDN